MMEIESVKVRRAGSETDTNAKLVVEVQDASGRWHELGRERLNGNFSICWSLPGAIEPDHRS